MPDFWGFTLGNSVKYKSGVIWLLSRNVSLHIVKARVCKRLWRLNFDVIFMAKRIEEILIVILIQVSK